MKTTILQSLFKIALLLFGMVVGVGCDDSDNPDNRIQEGIEISGILAKTVENGTEIKYPTEITPFLTLRKDLTFEGDAVCNSIKGDYKYSADNGHVARGICTTNEEGELVNITERTRIEKRDGKIAFTENDGETWENLPEDTLVSMNMWGFTRSILDELKAEFPQFLKKGLTENPMKCEYFLPAVVSNLLEADRATAAVLPSADKWYGVTYKEDKPVVVEAIRNLKKEGLYPGNLWEE